MSKTFRTEVLRGIIAWVCAVTISACAQAGFDLRRVDAAVDQHERDGFTGMAVIAVDGEIVYARGVGSANPDTGQPIGLDTQFDIASITKSVTGLLAAELMASGDLAAQARLGDFFPDVPPHLAPITVHHLLTHSAGLRGGVGHDYEALDFDSLRQRAFQTSLLFEPGTDYRYSNLGYSVLAGILEQVTGQSYEALVIEMFRRAGADSTGYLTVFDESNALVSEEGQSLVESSWGGHAPGWNLIGNGGLASTARDLVAWRHSAVQDALVFDLAHQPHQREGAGAPSHYGYGMVVEDLPELGRIHWHNGGSRQFSTHWREFADRDVLIVVLANQHSVTADDMVDALTTAWFDLGE